MRYLLKDRFEVHGADDWFVNDLASACRTGVFDVDKKEWSTEIFDALDLDKNKFPTIVKAGAVVGKISHYIAMQTNLSVGTLICVGAMDQNFSYYGGGLVNKGTVIGVIGTDGAIYIAVDESIRDPNKTLIFTNNSDHDNYTFEAASITSASSYKWYRDTFATLEKAYSNESGEDPYDLINLEIDTVPPGSKGLIFLLPVSILEATETGCLGDALYAGIGAGVYKDYKETVDRAVRIKEVYEPNPEKFESYDAAYKRFVVGYKSLNKGGFFRLLNKLSEEAKGV